MAENDDLVPKKCRIILDFGTTCFGLLNTTVHSELVANVKYCHNSIILSHGGYSERSLG